MQHSGRRPLGGLCEFTSTAAARPRLCERRSPPGPLNRYTWRWCAAGIYPAQWSGDWQDEGSARAFDRRGAAKQSLTSSSLSPLLSSAHSKRKACDRQRPTAGLDGATRLKTLSNGVCWFGRSYSALALIKSLSLYSQSIVCWNPVQTRSALPRRNKISLKASLVLPNEIAAFSFIGPIIPIYTQETFYEYLLPLFLTY